MYQTWLGSGESGIWGKHIHPFGCQRLGSGKSSIGTKHVHSFGRKKVRHDQHRYNMHWASKHRTYRLYARLISSGSTHLIIGTRHVHSVGGRNVKHEVYVRWIQPLNKSRTPYKWSKCQARSASGELSNKTRTPWVHETHQIWLALLGRDKSGIRTKRIHSVGTQCVRQGQHQIK